MKLAACIVSLGALLMAPGPAAAQALWLQRGDVIAQAVALELGPRCVAVTAAHAVGRIGARPRLSTPEGRVFGAEVIGLDAGLDAALLLLDDTARRDNGGCPAVSALDAHLLAEFEREQIGQPALWIELVASRLGGLDRFDLALAPPQPGHPLLEFSAKAAPDPLPVSTDGRIHSQWSSERALESLAHPRSFGRMPQMGHSGAGLWLGDRSTGHWTHGRYQNGQPQPKAPGHLAGMFIRLSGSSGRAIGARALQGFVAGLVRPFEPQRLTMEVPAGVSVAYRPGQSNRPFVDFYSIPYVSSFEFDLGTEALEFSAVELEFDAGEAALRRAAPLQAFPAEQAFSDIRVEVSTQAPSKAGPRLQVGCRNLAEVPASVTRDHVVRVRCQLAEVTVPAGITVALRGAPLTWRALRLELRR